MEIVGDHPEIVMAHRDAAKVARTLEVAKRVEVVVSSSRKVALDVGDDAEILVDPGANTGRRPAESKRFLEDFLCRREGTGLEFDRRAGVQSLSGRIIESCPSGNGDTFLATAPGRGTVAVAEMHDGEAS